MCWGGGGGARIGFLEGETCPTGSQPTTSLKKKERKINPSYVIGKWQKETPEYEHLETGVMSQNNVFREACLKHEGSVRPRPPGGVAAQQHSRTRDLLWAGDPQAQGRQEQELRLPSRLFCKRGGRWNLMTSLACGYRVLRESLICQIHFPVRRFLIKYAW